MSSPWTVRATVPLNNEISVSERAGIASLTLFEHGALAIGETNVDNGAIELIAGFDSEVAAENALEALTRQLDDVAAEVSLDPDHEQWVVAQRDGLNPTVIGQWHIRAPWHEPPEANTPGMYDVVIDPGPAFGHGAHPSTRLAIELMLRQLETPPSLSTDIKTVVDIGTGTGVIAIIAARSGQRVRASELDADSAEIAHKNIVANSVADLVALTKGSAADSLVEPHDLVVANVTIDVHRHLSPTYESADRIIVAGLLCGQVNEMASLLPDHTAHTIGTNGDWAGMSFLRTRP